jgi:hypothetical protein
MSSGLGSLGWGEQALMVIRFKGEITKKEAEAFNVKLEQALKELSPSGAKGGSGQVIANNAGRVSVIRSRKSKPVAPPDASGESSPKRSA